MSAGRPTADRPGTEPAGTARVTVGLVALVSLIAFEALGVATAMPVVAEDLGAVRSYALAFSVFLTASLLGTVVGGGYADARGPRGPVVGGLVLFCAGLLGCGAAPTFAVLLLGRAVSGLGAGFLVVALYVVVARCYPEAQRPRVFGWVSAAWVLPSVLGPPVAGWLATDVSWRVVFFAVPPFVLASAGLLLGVLDRLGPPAAPAGGGRRRALLGAAVAGGAFALQWGARGGQTWPVALAWLAPGAALLAAGLPGLLPAGTLRAGRGLASVVAGRGLLTASFFAAETFVPLMLVRERGLSPAVAGLALTGAALGWFAGAWAQARPDLRVSRSALLTAGGLVVAASVAALPVLLVDGVPPLLLLPLWAVAGLGMGLATSTSSVLLLGFSAVGEEGRNSAALQLSDALGSVLGIGAAGAVFAALHTTDGADGPAYVLIWTGCAVVGVAAGLVGRRARPEGTHVVPVTLGHP